jgi:hypothetical protein
MSVAEHDPGARTPPPVERFEEMVALASSTFHRLSGWEQVVALLSELGEVVAVAP